MDRDTTQFAPTWILQILKIQGAGASCIG